MKKRLIISICILVIISVVFIYKKNTETIDEMNYILCPITYNMEKECLEYHNSDNCTIPIYTDTEQGVTGNIIMNCDSIQDAATFGAYPCELCW